MRHLAVGVALFVVSLVHSTQAARAEDRTEPAASNVPGAATPGIHPDGRITFTLEAPDARTVEVAGGD